jgi:phospholipid/cholesterol/gamma-HCH transport system substrate-binding protein
MSTKTNNFKLGMFIIITVVILLIGIFFLGARDMFRQEWEFETYFDQSVQGLEVGSPVKMKGVTMGSVKKICFAYEEYDTELSYVYVLFSCDPQTIGAKRTDQTPEQLKETVKKLNAEGMRLTLDIQGITGTAILDAQFYEPGKYEALKIDWDPKHPYVPSVSGTLARMGETLEKTLDNLSQIDFAAMGEKVDQSLASVEEMLDGEIKPMVAELREEVIPALANIRKATESAPEAMARLSIIQEGISDWIREQKGSLAEVVDNLQAISENLRQLTENARRDPSQVIFGEPPPPSKVIK